MFSHVEMAMGQPYDLPYSVELWDDEDRHVEELIALTGDYRVAKAAFDEAVKQRPGRIVTLRKKHDYWLTVGIGNALSVCRERVGTCDSVSDQRKASH
jgi:hypothetical protein